MLAGEKTRCIFPLSASEYRKVIPRLVQFTKGTFEQVTDIVASTLVMSYDNKMNMSQYVFESDSVSDVNCEWWRDRIKSIIGYAVSHGFIKNLDVEIMSYSIWNFNIFFILISFKFSIF